MVAIGGGSIMPAEWLRLEEARSCQQNGCDWRRLDHASRMVAIGGGSIMQWGKPG